MRTARVREHANLMQHFTLHQSDLKLMAAKFHCSKRYVSDVLKGYENPETILAKAIIYDSLQLSNYNYKLELPKPSLIGMD